MKQRKDQSSNLPASLRTVKKILTKLKIFCTTEIWVSHFGRTGKHGTRHPIPRLESLLIGQKPTIIRFIIHKPSTHNKLCHPAHRRSESNPLGYTRKSWTHSHPVIFPDLHHKRKRIKSQIHPASSFPSITPATQKLSYPLGRQRKHIY